MKKKINILLIIIVLALWGGVAYKVINRFFSSEGEVFMIEDYNHESDLMISERDTFIINSINRDPFLDEMISVNKEKPILKKDGNKQFKKISKPITKIPFPIIYYYGYIKSKEKELVLLKINGQLKKMRLNETSEGIKIKKIFKDSVFVVVNGETKSFERS